MLLPVLAAVIAFVYALVLATVVATRVRPEVPAQKPTILAVVATVIAAGLAFTVHDWWITAGIALAVPIFVVAGVIDSQTKRLPNAYSLHALALCVLVTVAAAVTGHASVLVPAVIAGAVTFVAFLTMNLVSGNGFGMGDVKVGALMVYLLVVFGTVGWTTSSVAVLDNLVVTLFVTGWCFLSFFAGTAWILTRRLMGSKDGIPFGPFMVAGWFIAVAGAPLIHNILIPTT